MLCDRENEREDQEEGVQDTVNGVWDRHMFNEEGTKKKLEVGEMCMLQWMYEVTKLDMITNYRMRGQQK